MVVWGPVDFEISKAAVPLPRAGDHSMSYGGVEPPLPLSVPARRSSDLDSVLSGALSRGPGENVGLYTITLGSLTGSAHCDTVLTELVGIQITEATVKVTQPTDYSKYYGAASSIVPRFASRPAVTAIDLM